MKNAIVLLALLASPSALACSIMRPSAFETTPNPADTTAPTAELREVGVKRGQGPRGGMATSCDDIGFLTVMVALSDDTSAPGDIGVKVEVVSGEAPDLGGVLDGPVTLREQDGVAMLPLHWVDGATDDQEPLSFVLGVTPVDRAGNEGARVEVPVTHDGEPAPDVGPPGPAPVEPPPAAPDDAEADVSPEDTRDEPPKIAPAPRHPRAETGCSSVGGWPAWLAVAALPLVLRRRR